MSRDVRNSFLIIQAEDIYSDIEGKLSSIQKDNGVGLHISGTGAKRAISDDTIRSMVGGLCHHSGVKIITILCSNADTVQVRNLFTKSKSIQTINFNDELFVRTNFIRPSSYSIRGIDMFKSCRSNRTTTGKSQPDKQPLLSKPG